MQYQFICPKCEKEMTPAWSPNIYACFICKITFEIDQVRNNTDNVYGFLYNSLSIHLYNCFCYGTFKDVCRQYKLKAFI